MFPVVDRDSDGRPSSLELAQLLGVLGNDSSAELPRIMRLELGVIPLRVWGGITIAGKKPSAEKVTAPTGPKWFLSLDRNRDDIVSRREFLGPPWVFTTFDRNGAGVLEASEAASKKNK